MSASGLGDPARHGIEDARRFVAHALDDELRSKGATFNEDKYEECHAYLLADLCELAATYDPVGMRAARAVRERTEARTARRAEWKALSHYSRSRRRVIRARDFDQIAELGRELAGFLDRRGVSVVAEILGFSTYSYRIVRQRYTDFLREQRGDARYGNDGRQETVADVDDYGGSVTDELDFAAVIHEIDHDKLSIRARGALREIGVRVASGMSVTDAAAEIGKSRREASGDLERLRMELAN